MKNVYALCFLLLSNFLISQTVNIRGLLRDSATKEPIIAGSIGIQNTGMGTISNEEGIFQLTAPKSGAIIISCLGYKLVTVPVSDFTLETQTILLEQSEEVLEEVMVTKVPLHQILKEVVETSVARFNKPILLHTYYREFVRENNKYTKFSDGLIDYHVTGTTKKTKSALIIQQNRSFFLGKSEKEEDESMGSFLNVQRGIISGYSFTYLTEYVFSEGAYEEYEFNLKSKKDKSGNEYYSISFVPKSEVEKALYQGTITYDPKTKLIYEVDVFMAPTHKSYAKTRNFLIAKVAFLDSKYKAAYKVVNNNYLMSYNNRYLKVHIWNKKNDYLSESRSDLIVTDFEKDNQSYNKKDVFTKKDLYDKSTSYKEKFWQTNNAIVLTSEEEKIIASLEKEAIVVPKNQ